MTAQEASRSSTRGLPRSPASCPPSPRAGGSTSSGSSRHGANGQPAFGCYLRDPHAPIAHAYCLMVTLSGERVAAITGFPDTSVFPHFGLPRTLPAGEDPDRLGSGT